MYQKLKEFMPAAEYFYGPMSQEQAFNIPVHSYATLWGNNWFAGTNVLLEDLAELLVPAPVVLGSEPPVE